MKMDCLGGLLGALALVPMGLVTVASPPALGTYGYGHRCTEIALNNRGGSMRGPPFGFSLAVALNHRGCFE